jgi:hypothetical protein
LLVVLECEPLARTNPSRRQITPTFAPPAHRRWQRRTGDDRAVPGTECAWIRPQLSCKSVTGMLRNVTVG